MERLGDLPYLYEGAHPCRDEDEQGGLLVHQVKEDDGLTEGPPQDRLPAEALHALLPPPEVDVALEGETVEKEVDGGDTEGDDQEDKVGIGEDPFDLVGVLLCETHTLQGAS